MQDARACLQDVGSLGNDEGSKRGTNLKLGKSLEIYGGVYHPSCNLRLLTKKDAHKSAHPPLKSDHSAVE